MRQIKIIVEKHTQGYSAYPIGFKGIVVGDGNTFEEALANMKSELPLCAQAFGEELRASQAPILDVFVTEAEVAI